MTSVSDASFSCDGVGVPVLAGWISPASPNVNSVAVLDAAALVTYFVGGVVGAAAAVAFDIDVVVLNVPAAVGMEFLSLNEQKAFK